MINVEEESDTLITLDAMPIGVLITDAKHNAVHVNPQFTAITGWTLETIRIHARDHQGGADRLLQRRMVAVNDMIRTAFVGQNQYSGEHRYRRKDESEFECRITVRPIMNNGRLVQRLTTIEDITEQVNYKHTLERQTRMYGKLINAVPAFITHFEIKSKNGGIVSTLLGELLKALQSKEEYKDKFKRQFDFRFLFASNGSRALLGLMPDEICDKEHYAQTLFDLIHKDDQDLFFERLFKSAMHGTSCQWSGRFTLNGEIKFVQLDSTTEIQHRGDTVQWYCSGMDVTAARETERNVASYVAHEIQNPLSSIIGALKQLNGDPRAKATIRQSVNYMKHVSSDLQMLNELYDSHGKEIQMESIVLKDVVNHAMTILQGTAPVTLHNEVKCDIQVVSSTKLLLQFFVNVITNAFKHMKTGEITVTAERIEGNMVQIMCRDTGDGMSQEAVDNIFQKYYKDTSDSASTSSGLGMYLVKKWVKQLGGRILVESTQSPNPNHGTTYTLKIPDRNEPVRIGTDEVNRGAYDLIVDL